MNSLRFHRVFEFFAGVDLAMGILWLGLAAFTLGLLVLRYTRWGQSHQLEKCMLLSVLAHVLILGYVATMRIVNPPSGGESMCFIALEEDTDSEKGEPGGNRPTAGKEKNDGKDQPWQIHSETASSPIPPSLNPIQPIFAWTQKAWQANWKTSCSPRRSWTQRPLIKSLPLLRGRSRQILLSGV